MRASTRRAVSILLSGMFLIGIIVVATALIRPALSTVTEKRVLLVSKQNLFESQRSAVDQVQRLVQEFQGFAKVQETVNLAVPRSEETTRILNQLDSIARTAGVTFSSFNSSPKAFETSRQPLARRLGTLELSVVVSGSYEQIKQFLKFIETNVRVFNVQRFIFSPAGERTGSSTYRITLKIDTYFQD